MTDITESPSLTQGWRNTLKVHPVANAFPLLPEQELKALAGDIQREGLKNPIVLWAPADGAEFQLLDGRNRLDALELLGRIVIDDGRLHEGIDVEPVVGGDPKKLAYSLNVHRRHLTAEQKRELILRLLKENPEKSDRQIGKEVKADNKTVAAVRKHAERRGEIPHTETRTDSMGRKQSARKTSPMAAPANVVSLRPEHSANGNGVDPATSAAEMGAKLAALDDAGDEAAPPTPEALTETVTRLGRKLIEIDRDGARTLYEALVMGSLNIGPVLLRVLAREFDEEAEVTHD